MKGAKAQDTQASRRATERRERPTSQYPSGEVRLRAALRRWGRGRPRLPPSVRGTAATPGQDSPQDWEAGRAGTGRWWPRLTPPQVQTLLGAAITLALLLWDQLRQRLGQP